MTRLPPTIDEQIAAIEQQITYCRTVISFAILGRARIVLIDDYELRVERLEAAIATLRLAAIRSEVAKPAAEQRRLAHKGQAA